MSVNRRRTPWMLAAGLAAAAVWVLAYRNLAGLARWMTYGLAGLEPGSSVASAVEFFVYEAPKVLMLLVVVVFGVGIVRSFFTPERTRRVLAGRRESAGNVLAALLGTVTPFCSCSAVPLFIGFVTTGVPLGVTFSFLDLGADGERGGAGAALRPAGLEGGGPVHEHRPGHRDCIGLDDRQAGPRALRRAMGIRGARRCCRRGRCGDLVG